MATRASKARSAFKVIGRSSTGRRVRKGNNRTRTLRPNVRGGPRSRRPASRANTRARRAPSYAVAANREPPRRLYSARKLSLGNRPSALREYSAFRRLRKNISCARSCLASMGPRGSSSNSSWTCSATISETLIRPGAPHATAGVGAVAAPVGQFHPNHALIAAGGILLGRLGLESTSDSEPPEKGVGRKFVMVEMGQTEKSRCIR